MSIRCEAERLVYSEPGNPWIKLYFDDVVFPNGSRGRYNRVIEGTGAPGVAVLPILQGRVGLIEQYKYAISERVWQLPMGYADAPDSESEARRELFEETGLSAARVVSLGQAYPSAGVLATKIDLFAAFCDEARAQAELEAGETLPFHWIQVEEALKMAASGGIKESMTLVALFRARLLGLI
jgi:ADP-ribose pyrophosphatase